VYPSLIIGASSEDRGLERVGLELRLRARAFPRVRIRSRRFRGANSTGIPNTILSCFLHSALTLSVCRSAGWKKIP
jgi:hypothetical protein